MLPIGVTVWIAYLFRFLWVGNLNLIERVWTGPGSRQRSFVHTSRTQPLAYCSGKTFHLLVHYHYHRDNPNGDQFGHRRLLTFKTRCALIIGTVDIRQCTQNRNGCFPYGQSDDSPILPGGFSTSYNSWPIGCILPANFQHIVISFSLPILEDKTVEHSGEIPWLRTPGISRINSKTYLMEPEV